MEKGLKKQKDMPFMLVSHTWTSLLIVHQLSTKDYSGEYFVQLSSLSLEEIIRIKEYVDKECMNYWSISHNPEGNMIAYSTWKFYNSKDLDNFIHKTLRKNIGNNER